jgi:hypothetical protein
VCWLLHREACKVVSLVVRPDDYVPWLDKVDGHYVRSSPCGQRIGGVLSSIMGCAPCSGLISQWEVTEIAVNMRGEVLLFNVISVQQKSLTAILNGTRM